ncbi:peptidase inhibitor family I36 protein [Candidatus Bipolaricaulota bacterium]
MWCARRGIITVVSVAVFFLAAFDVGGVANAAVDPYEVVVWQHANFTGQHQSFRLEDAMRHRLVIGLGYFDERISAIQVGSQVRVAVYRFPGFAGPSAVVSTDVHSLSDYWNDVISSLIVFPRTYGNNALDHPLGVTLKEVSCYTATGYTPAYAFYPLPQSEKSTEAGYSHIGSYMDDNVFYVGLQGNDVEAELFYERNFGSGTYTLTFPKDAMAEHPSAMYSCSSYGYREIDLTFWYPWATRGRWEGVTYISASSKTQSLKVRWAGTPPGNTRSPGFVGSQSGPSIEEPEGSVGQPEFIPDISGTWDSSFGIVYVITQNGHDFTWHVERFRELGHGTIYDSALEVSWEGENGSGHDMGIAIFDDHDEVARIEWGHGNVFLRRERSPG